MKGMFLDYSINLVQVDKIIFSVFAARDECIYEGNRMGEKE